MDLYVGSFWGNRQWGYQTVHGTNPVTYDLPIPFEEAPFTVAISTGNSGNHASCGGFTKTTIVLRAGTTAGVWDTVGFFIIGCQLQWGINSAGNNGSEGESGWYAFPVNFNSACFALFCGLRNTDTNNPTNYDSEVQPRNWTTTKFNVYKQNYGGNPWFGSFIWFAIGRQPASYKL